MTIKQKKEKVVDFYKNGSIDDVRKRIEQWFDIYEYVLAMLKSWNNECIKNEYDTLIFKGFINEPNKKLIKNKLIKE